MTGQELIAHALNYNQAALDFVQRLAGTLHVWDDLVDRDNPVSADGINQAFYNALVELPGNIFYQRHFSEIYPLMSVLVSNWLAANQLEADGDDLALHIAFIIRSDYCNVLLKCAQIAGGIQRANQLWPDIRRHIHEEGFAGYVTALAAERAAREGV